MLPNRSTLRCLLYVSVLTLIIASLQAGVKRIEVRSREPILGGKEFGTAGAYEKITGVVFFSVDPANAHSRGIIDLDKAQRNGDGQVAFSSNFCILRPVDPRRGNGTLLLEISNRGGKGMLRFFNHGRSSSDPKTEEDFGDGFLLRHGFTLAWLGWQYDVPDGESLMRLIAPIATDGGKTITGLVRSDFVFPARVYETSLGHRGQKAQPVANPLDPSAVLTFRGAILGRRDTIPRTEWQFAKQADGRVVADSTSLFLKSGFEPGKIYEVVYRTQNPVIVGLGLAAVRDFVSHMKHEPTNILSIDRALGFGISQSGRYLRQFLYQGFNADEQGRKVFDGVDAHVAGGGRGSFNHRFAEPSRDASPFSTFFFPTDIFPFTDVEQTDPETGDTDGILTHVDNSNVLPRIFYTFSSYEYWGRSASLIHTTIDGKSDAPMMENSRVYFFAGGQHGPGSFPPSIPSVRGLPLAQNKVSPNDYTYSMRALLLALDRWVRNATPPPASRYPRIAKGELVRPQDVRFPDIPGIHFPRTIHEAYRIDYGPEWKTRGIIAFEPPHVGKAFPALVPQVDEDGIDLGGVRLPEVSVPLATYTGWNPRSPQTGAERELVDFLGSYLPFPRTRDERLASGDPRLSVEERYGNRQQYLRSIEGAIANLAMEGFLLQEDGPQLLTRAGQYWDAMMK
jgi:hypothetical protein